jgi:two-component system, LytTR family, response regulator
MNMRRLVIVDDKVQARQDLRSIFGQGPRTGDLAGSGDGRGSLARARHREPGADVPAGPEPVSPALLLVLAGHDRQLLASLDADAVAGLFALARDQVDSSSHKGHDLLVEQLRDLLATSTKNQKMIERFTVKTGGKFEVFHVDEIDWIEADEYYTKLHIGDRTFMIRESMRALEEQLPADRFVRIHRSTIVNLDRMAALEPAFNGNYSVILKDGTCLRMSRRRREHLSAYLRNFS